MNARMSRFFIIVLKYFKKYTFCNGKNLSFYLQDCLNLKRNVMTCYKEYHLSLSFCAASLIIDSVQGRDMTDYLATSQHKGILKLILKFLILDTQSSVQQNLRFINLLQSTRI